VIEKAAFLWLQNETHHYPECEFETVNERLHEQSAMLFLFASPAVFAARLVFTEVEFGPALRAFHFAELGHQA
jgi:hypothetical protein